MLEVTCYMLTTHDKIYIYRYSYLNFIYYNNNYNTVITPESFVTGCIVYQIAKFNYNYIKAVKNHFHTTDILYI